MAKSKLDYLQQKKLNPTDDLRDLLSRLEEREPKLKKMSRAEALTLLRDLDHALALLKQLSAEGVTLTSEQVRFRAFQKLVKKRGRQLLKALGGVSELENRRPEPPPDPEERWWWYIDRDVAARQRQFWLKAGLIASASLLLLAGVYLAFQTVLAPSPEALARAEAETDSIDAFSEGDYDQALAEIEQGLEVVPDDPGLHIMAGVFQELREQPEAAAQNFERAKAGVDDLSVFYVGRGQIYYRTGQYAKSEQDARQAIELDERSAVGWLLLAQSFEMQGRRIVAMEAYEQAGELALDSGQDEIVVLARLALGRLIGQTP